jgi:hypothetical protein
MLDLTNFFIQPHALRPEFWLVIVFVFGHDSDVDTDGDSYNPASREWTELYCLNRKQPQEVFDVDPVSDSPLTLRISSKVSELAARVAYYLARETKSPVAASESGPWHDPEWLAGQVGSFDLAEASARAPRSR